MKNFKRIASVVMVLMMMLSMMLPAMAGKINVPQTITDDKNEAKETYTAYKIFDVSKLMVQDTDDDGNPLVDKDNKPIMKEAGWAYSILKDDPWVEKLNGKITEGEGEGANTTPAQGFVELTISADGTQYIVKPVGDFASTDAATASAAAKDFAAWLLNNKPTVNGIILNEGENTVADGYYLITSSLGSALALTTTDVAVDITEKNSYPTLTKSVDDHEAQIGDTVEFTIKVTVPATVNSKLTVHDTIEKGFTVNEQSFEYKLKDIKELSCTEETHDHDDNCYITEKTVNGTKSPITKDDKTGNQSFTIEFEAVDVAGGTLVITYSAKLNKDAEIATETNDNTAYLTYSKYQTPDSTVSVSTYEATVTKVIAGSTTQLDGAEFKLYTSETDTNAIQFVEIKDTTDKVIAYRVADATETAGTTDTIKIGTTVIKGLDSDTTYYLKETKAPDGYNMLDSRKPISLTENNTNKNVQITVENSSGTELPSTGGIGTTIFYCAGAILAVGAFVLLITKKRMGKEV